MDMDTQPDTSVLQTLISSLPVGIITCKFDAYFTVEEVNEGFFRLSGYTDSDLMEQYNRRLVEMIHPDDRQKIFEKISVEFLNNEPVFFAGRILCRDGFYKRIQFNGQFVHSRGEDEKIAGVMTEENKTGIHGLDGQGAAEVLSPFSGDHDIRFNNTDIMICEWNIAEDTLLFSHNWNRKGGRRQVYNQVYSDVSSHERIHPDDISAFTAFLEELKGGSLYATAEFRLLNLSGEYAWCQAHAVTMYDRHEKPAKAVGVIFDIDEKKRAMDVLKTRAERDALTGLYNRNETEKRIKAYLDERPAKLCALFMIDTDNFKQINDTKGHMLGDIVLTEMAFGMKKIMGEGNVVGRIGGDEFTVFMKNISTREEAVQKAKDLSEMFRHLFEHEKHSVQITCSIGVALYPEDGGDFQTLYRHADQALYQAKSQGKNGYVIYDKENSCLIEATGYSSLGAAIDSQPTSMGVSRDLITYVFKLLYRMEDLEQAVNMSLEVVGKWFDVSRAYIFETGGNGEYYKNTYEWCNEGIKPEIDNLQHLDVETAGDYRELFGEDSIYYCRDTHALPPVQRKLFEDQGIHSFLQYALWEKEKFAGFIGFDECTGVRLWTKEEVKALSRISELLDTFLQKKKLQEQEQKMQLLVEKILEQEEDYIYVIKKGTYEIVYFNNKMRQIIPRLKLGERCYETLFYSEQPCKFCPLLEETPDPGDTTGNHFCSLMSDSPVRWKEDNVCFMAFHHLVRKIAGQKTGNEKESEQHTAAEKSIVDCIQWLTTSDYMEDSIEYVLNIILEYYQSDRVYIIETDEEHGVASNTFEVCADGVNPQIDNLQNVTIEAISFWMKQFSVRDYIKIDDIEDLGEDRQVEYEVLKEQGVKSLMALPLYVKGDMKGFLGLDDPKVNKENFEYLEELSYFIESEITKNSMRRRLERMSYEDTLTGLENRNSYMAYCDDFSKRLPVPAGAIFMDINGLKKLNEVRGHVYGDMVIIHVADIIKQYFPNERKFRLSGDEFLIVTESVTYDEFKLQMDQMEEKFSSNGTSIVSVGTTWSDVAAELTELMNKAERMMRIRKKEYYKEYQEVAAEKIPLLKELSEAIINRQFLIYLQPKFNTKTQKVDRAEVLVRYREKDGSISSPIKFIPFLESEGLISSIDFFVMDEVCRLLTKWKNTELADIQLSLNFSRITMFDKNFFDEFWKIFRKYDLRPGQLEVEITETQETLNKKQMAVLLEELKKHDFQIALDDFGVEYSSYEFLMMANFDVLKIDKGIIQKYGETVHGKTLVRHIVDMVHSIGIKCCAEGVETQEQYNYMKEIGCDYIQGYLIDRPIPVDQFERKYVQSGTNPADGREQNGPRPGRSRLPGNK